MVLSLLQSTDDDRSHKEAIPLLNVIGQLCQHLEPSSEQFKQVQEWVQKVCVDQPIGKIYFLY